MKTNYLSGILSLLFCVVGLTNCNDHLVNPNEKDPEGGGGEGTEAWMDSIPDGSFFGRANTLRLYYIDEKGNSLINPDDPNTYPVSWSNKLENPIERTNDRQADLGTDIIRYNGNHNWIYLDEGENLYYCTLSAYGDERHSTYTFPIYVNGDTDQLDVTYKYTDKDVIGGKYYAKIVSWKYNGTHIYSDDDEHDKKVFIRKSEGKTTVSFER
ncbi:hypothetical protein [uncultured Parabacteroides sp.]|jgi:hypothetical protein|uniref:hypothetical protein n=1 Tax=uncultured Parabacteroides sp. TaxID=512312 RepID=UPI0025E496F6|nr:hypothetical protein [uncultured Parabacteroides sp.]